MSYKNLTFNSKKKRGFEAHLFSTYFRVPNKCRGRNIYELGSLCEKKGIVGWSLKIIGRKKDR